MLEINGIPENVWNDTQKMLQEAMDEYVPNYLTLAVSKAIVKARSKAFNDAADIVERIPSERANDADGWTLRRAAQAIRQHSQKGRDT